MKIAIFSWETRYSLQISGIATHTTELAEALAREGHQVHIFTRQGPQQALEDLINGVFYHRCPWSRSQNFLNEVSEFNKSLYYYYNEVHKQIGGFNVIHCHDWLTFEAGCKIREEDSNLHFVATFHTTEWGRSGAWPEGGEPRMIADLEATATQTADSVIVISYEIRRQIELLYRCPEWKVSVIYHGIDLNNFDNNKIETADILARYDFPQGAKIVLYVGALNFRKGADLMSAAIAKISPSCRDARFIFAGSGEMRGRIEGELNSAGFGAVVRYTENPTPLELLHLYHAAAIVCIPYRYDPFGVVALSAWAAGKPIVVSGDGAAAEFIYNKVNGLRCSEGSIADSVNLLLSEDDQARWMGRNGRVAVETAFSWDSVAEQCLTVYNKSAQSVLR